RRLLERIYRSGWVPGLYYMIEIWWNRMFFPTKAAMPTRRPIFLKDCALVSAYGLLWIGLLVWAGQATGQSIFRLTLFGFVVPFLFWCAMIGLPPMTGGHRGFGGKEHPVPPYLDHVVQARHPATAVNAFEQPACWA
ncbi:MAG TPA: hypothetical protein VHN11_02275, partial [Xanthobacteraceae bacterium]|nr:hypothetical protein [Xanthobacteraceae bacterium]